jgi:ribonuclease VapC
VIVDTSALIAILIDEPGRKALAAAIYREGGVLPSPARVEFIRVASSARFGLHDAATALLGQLERQGLQVVPLTPEQARIACEANAVHGSGQGQGGMLNLIDLMVYAVAVDRGQPILCTGRDFAATGVAIHPASRP